MTFDDSDKTQDGALLWRRAESQWRKPEGAPEGLDPMLAAAYLDGSLGEEERAAVEALLARDPALLEEMLALSQLEPETPPVSLMLRAQGLVRQASPRESEPARGVFSGFSWLRSMGWASAAAAMLLAWGLAFELGFSGLEAAQAVDRLATRDFLVGASTDDTLL